MPRPAIRSVGLSVKPDSPEAGKAAGELAKWLQDRGIEVLLDPETGRWVDGRVLERAEICAAVDLMVVMGGDGTLLAAAREAGETPVPLLGVNLGTLGFLAEVGPDEQSSLLERILRGEFETVTRSRLRVRARRAGEDLMDELALNDAVISRNELSRLIDLEASADATTVTTYHGDGLIVSTPTGSTAYCLSAGGPILMPGSHVYVLTPICPHGLTHRPLVLSEESRLAIRVHPRGGTAQLTVDGQVGVTLERDDVVMVEASEHPVHMVVSPMRSRFEVLRTKLGWGAG